MLQAGEGSNKRRSHLDGKRNGGPGLVHSGLWEDALLHFLEELNLLSECGGPPYF